MGARNDNTLLQEDGQQQLQQQQLQQQAAAAVEDCDVHVSEEKGVSNLWSSVNHIAIVVSDVGRSLQFYTEVVGMKQILRPDFDRLRKKLQHSSCVLTKIVKLNATG